MPEWNDNVILLSSKPHGETGLLTSVFSRYNGRYKAFVYGGNSQKKRSTFQKGNLYNAHWKEKNPEKKQETCISLIEKTRSEFCTILNKQISLTNIAVKEKTLAIVKKYPKNIITKDKTVLKKIVKSSKIEDLAKNSDIYKRR